MVLDRTITTCKEPLKNHFFLKCKYFLEARRYDVHAINIRFENFVPFLNLYSKTSFCSEMVCLHTALNPSYYKLTLKVTVDQLIWTYRLITTMYKFLQMCCMLLLFYFYFFNTFWTILS